MKAGHKSQHNRNASAASGAAAGSGGAAALDAAIAQLSHELQEECRVCAPHSQLGAALRAKLQSHPPERRREITRRYRDGCAPLFIAAKRGCVPIVQYLITECHADIEQKGMFEVAEDSSVHWVTPLWCAAVSGQLAVLKTLLRHNGAINAASDTGSTPVRSACFMTNLEVVHFLVDNGADIRRANYNGGTCLINSVQSVPLCEFLIGRGADVNAKDIQDKTALHYAIQEHRLETTQLLLRSGADPFARSRYGDDALQTACLKGAIAIFDYLRQNVEYTAERLASSHELIGSTFLDEHNETRIAVHHWQSQLNLACSWLSVGSRTLLIRLCRKYLVHRVIQGPSSPFGAELVHQIFITFVEFLVRKWK